MTLEEMQALLPATHLYRQSVQYAGGETYCYARDGHQHYLLIAFDPRHPPFHRETFSGETQDFDAGSAIKWCLPSHSNARKLRRLFPWTAPQPLGLQRAFGVGDRIGLAAPAQLQAARDCQVALVLAQQSLREMASTGRRPDEVLDAATWGVFQENFQRPWGADADRLKTKDEVSRLAQAGFTFFTIDPSDHVDDSAGTCAEAELRRKFAACENAEELVARYAERECEVPAEQGSDPPLVAGLSHATLMRAVVKYGAAVSHTVALVQVLDEIKGRGHYDLELSVDETASPTTVAEHYFIASELKRRGVELHSLAPRLVGAFQKGIDYIGDRAEFAARLREHVRLARALGPYKISLHSGSDKFAIYPAADEIAGELLHVKTSGTWYLEALRTVARCDPALFRAICQFAASRFNIDRATYPGGEDLHDLPDVAELDDAALERVLDSDTGRQMLHTTFGSVLTDRKENGGWRFRDRIYRLLLDHEELHHELVRRHARRHLRGLGMCGGG